MRCRFAFAMVIASAFVLFGNAAAASPKLSRWQGLLHPHKLQEEQLIRDVEAAIAESQLMRSMQDPLFAEARLRAVFARLKLTSAERSTSPHLRLLYADLLSHLDEHAAAASVLEGVVEMNPEPPARAQALSELAIAYAKLGRRTDEVRAYDQALQWIPIGRERSTMLANRAEALMAIGKTAEAAAGHREALSTLLPSEMLTGGVTTLWGLAVALDRSGDLEGAFEAIDLARSYDPADRMLSSPSWFYAPDYDEAYFTALGHWAAARRIEALPLKIEVYERATKAFAEYLERAPDTDIYRRIAEARRKRCEQELARVRKGLGTRRTR